MLTVENLTVAYRAEAGAYAALRDVTLELPPGGTCAIVGPSGCGKSTLLRVLAGIETSYKGTVLYGGKTLSPAERRIGFIPQNYGLLPWKTVRENICLGARVKDKTRAVDIAALSELMRRLGIDGLEARYPGELSGGQQQRVSLARAFFLRPDLLLMDEPFSALDAMTREEMQNVFLSVWRDRAVATVLVTHYVEEAAYLGQRIVILSACPGTVRAVVDNPLFGHADRNSRAFFEFCGRLRGLVQEGWSA